MIFISIQVKAIQEMIFLDNNNLNKWGKCINYCFWSLGEKLAPKF